MRTPRRLTAAFALLTTVLGAVVLAAPAARANSGVIAPNGAAVTATLTGSADLAKFAFNASSGGGVVNLTVSSGTFASGCSAQAEIVSSTGYVLGGPICAGSSAFLGSVVLPGGGRFYVELVPSGNVSGSAKLQLSLNAGDAAITPNAASPIAVAATRAGQGRKITFNGTAGQVVNVTASAGTYPGSCDVEVAVVDTRGRLVGGPACAGNSGFLGGVELSGTGSYVLQVIPTDGAIGSVKLQLSVNAADGVLELGGSPAVFTATRPGQGRNFSVYGNAGPSYTFAAGSGTYPGACDVEIAIADTTGRLLGGPVCAGHSGALTGVLLPANGPFFAEVIPTDGSTGSVSLTITQSG